MPAVAERKLTVEEFHSRYDGIKPYYEYWAGEAVQKSMPTWLHALVQSALGRLLDDLGFKAGPEVTLKLDPAYEPIPDVIAVDGPISGPYPVEPFALVIEILSPDDAFTRVLRKCRLYAQWGIERILVVDPAARIVWSFEDGALKETNVIARRGDRTASARDLWDEVDRLTAPQA
jgi:Uma2 family endonuclease